MKTRIYAAPAVKGLIPGELSFNIDVELPVASA